MKFSARLEGSRALADALGQVNKEYKRHYAQSLKKSVLMVHAEAVKSIREKSPGHKEFRYEPKRLVTVSRPGDPPNTDNGTLIKSVGFNVDETEMIAEVGTNLKYGKYLEFGTEAMKARPWLFPALQKCIAQILKLMRTPPDHQRRAS